LKKKKSTKIFRREENRWQRKRKRKMFRGKLAGSFDEGENRKV